MAGELEAKQRPTRRDLGAEAARLGESFGLGGPPQGAYRARRRSTQWGCGTSMLVAAGALALVIPELQHRLTPLWAIVAGAVTVGGLLLMAFAPRSKWDRLFWYPGGLAQRLAAEPEPKILRWADAATVRIAYDTSDDSLILDRASSTARIRWPSKPTASTRQAWPRSPAKRNGSWRSSCCPA